MFELGVCNELNEHVMAAAHEFYQRLSVQGPHVALVSARLMDDKSVVRKAAISLVRFVIGFDMEQQPTAATEISEKAKLLIAALEQRFRDPVMTLRKLTVRLMTDLLLDYPAMEEFWRLVERSLI